MELLEVVGVSGNLIGAVAGKFRTSALLEICYAATALISGRST